MRKEIRFSGFGGQGVALIGFILGKALTIYSEAEAVMTQSYGPEARGGASSVNLIVADEWIDYPFVQKPDILVALSPEGYTQCRHTAAENAVIITEENLVTPFDGDEVYRIPATRLAESLGRRVVANMVMLGFFAAVTGLVSVDALKQAVTSTVRPKTVQLNLQALETGYQYPVEKHIYRSGS